MSSAEIRKDPAKAESSGSDSSKTENPEQKKSVADDSQQKKDSPKESAKVAQKTDRATPTKDDEWKSNSQSQRHPWLFPLGIALVICGIGLIGILAHLRGNPDETHLEIMGNIDVRQVNLAFKVDGRIDKLNVDEGDFVKTNDIVATLDKRYFNDELRVLRARRDNLAANVAKLEHGSRPEEIAQARAQTADREAALIKAKEDFSRAESLVNKGGVSRQDFDRYQSSLNSAEAQFNSARESQRLVEIGPRQEDIDIARAALAEQDASISQSERRLTDANLLAPNDGIILTRARERGAIVQAGETVFSLTLTSPVWVRTYVSERDLGLIYPDMPSQVLTDSAPNKPYAGKIGFISPTAEFTPKTVETRELRTDLVYRLRVVVDNPDGGLRQGMPVTVRLKLSHPRRKTFWERMRDGFRSLFYSGTEMSSP